MAPSAMAAPAPFSVAVVLSTYDQPEHLERVLWGYARQTRRSFQLMIADDGSGPRTARVIERVCEEARLSFVHVWHEDRGFRKTEILNRCILLCDRDYMIFSDGDCIPAQGFVAAHCRHAEPDRYLSGGAIPLPKPLSASITVEDVRSGRVLSRRWLLDNGWRPGRRWLRLIDHEWTARLLDRVTPTARTWNGNNASTWREHLVAVNGFELDMAYGGEDRALGIRLENSGTRGKSVRYSAPLLHLWHERPYRDLEVLRRQREQCHALEAAGQVRATRGLAQLREGSPSFRIVNRREYRSHAAGPA